ncbi:MAG: flagellar biosynthetic protein FliR [Candidatus Eremiobacteraeota bacterium]|nr:flagellar biosynthetic protein FliR [Candidatus Eremiobacteraeota bacterium]
MAATIWFVFARAAGFVARAPGLRANVPVPLRAALALGLALVVVPQRRAAAHDALTFAALLAGESLFGALLGFAASLVSEAVGCAGRLLDDFSGVRAGVPFAAVAPPGIGGIWSLVFLAAFFALGGIELTIAAFARSFDLFPIGTALDPRALHAFVLGGGVAFVRLAVALAMPAISLALLVHLTVAAIGRVVPRFGNLTLAFPAAFAAVFLAAFAALAGVEALAAQPLAGLRSFSISR